MTENSKMQKISTGKMVQNKFEKSEGLRKYQWSSDEKKNDYTH